MGLQETDTDARRLAVGIARGAPRDLESVAPEELAAYPTLRGAARMIGVTPSALSKRTNLVTQQRGRERRVPPAEVLEWARFYRKRSLYEVASDLVDLALREAPGYVEAVESEIDRFFEHAGTGLVDPALFLQEAQRTLPPEVYEAVRDAYAANDGRRLGGAVSATPEDD
jgi:hypothetical protein